MNIRITSKGIPEVQAWLKTIANGVRTRSMEWVLQYLVGDQTHGLKHYPPYKYITMQRAYGGFKSDRQRRYVMAMIKEGKIDPGVPHRTGELQRGWTYRMWSQATQGTISNPTSYAQYVMGNEQQANMHKLIGWRTVMTNIKDNLQGAFRHARAELKKWLAAQKGSHGTR